MLKEVTPYELIECLSHNLFFHNSKLTFNAECINKGFACLAEHKSST